MLDGDHGVAKAMDKNGVHYSQWIRSIPRPIYRGRVSHVDRYDDRGRDLTSRSEGGCIICADLSVGDSGRHHNSPRMFHCASLEILSASTTGENGQVMPPLSAEHLAPYRLIILE